MSSFNLDIPHLLLKYDILVNAVQAISGGDTSATFRLQTSKECYFLKVISERNGLLYAENDGLIRLRDAGVYVPDVILYKEEDSYEVLLLEYIINNGISTPALEEDLANNLLCLHHTKGLQFGLSTDNFIGSLYQDNTLSDDWKSFYIQRRLQPQLKLAVDNGRLTLNEIPTEAQQEQILNAIMPQITPTLLHGDLWSGNYLFGQDSKSYMIDPSIYYGHHEVDLAMTRLFGGFGPVFYDKYTDKLPYQPQWQERQDLYQLYYLLVHLNLFGRGYKAQVVRILNRYF